MKYCIYCGAAHADDARFCTRCGKALESAIADQKDANAPKKCPQCGQFWPALSARCPSCGFEWRRDKSATKEFEERYLQAKSNNERINLIRLFPVPNSREDLLEFFILAASNIDEHVYDPTHESGQESVKAAFQRAFGTGDATLKQVTDAWVAKCDQIYQKALIALRGDPYLQQIKTVYGERKKAISEVTRSVKSRQRNKWLLVLVMILFLLGLIGFSVWMSLHT